MAEAMRGLKVKPTYEDCTGVAKSDGLENVKCPNRSSKLSRDGFVFITT